MRIIPGFRHVSNQQELWWERSFPEVLAEPGADKGMAVEWETEFPHGEPSPGLLSNQQLVKRSWQVALINEQGCVSSEVST